MIIMEKYWDWFYKKYIRSYRQEVISQYTTPPLLLGDGAHAFDMCSLVFHVMNVGPKFYPVPGGAFSDANNIIKFPAATQQGRDVFMEMDTRIRSHMDVDVDGVEVLANTPGTRWTPHSVITALVAGTVTQALKAAVAGVRNEISIQYIDVYPDPGPGVGELLFEWQTGGPGAIVGDVDPNFMPYHRDDANFILSGVLTKSFPNGGKHFANDTVNSNIEVVIVGGLGAEEITIGYLTREL